MAIDGFVRQLARHCDWEGREGDTVRLLLDAKVKHLLLEERRLTLEAALAAQLQQPVRLQIEVTAEVVASPATLEQLADIERQRAAEEAIHSDPVVKAFRDHFGATVRPGSIHPLNS